jgi:ABC-type multidrug transport system ATPase subunit
MLSVRRLERRFGHERVIEGLDLEVELGERVAVCGPNGAGKTTLLRCIAGTLTPSGGKILIGGHAAGSLAARRLLGVSLSQERSFYLRLTGRANLEFFARLRYASAAEACRAVREVEQRLGIEAIASRRVDRCSTGMIQQLALARALLGDPKLILLDEPTRSLDEAAARRLWDMFDGRAEVALVIATHREEDLAHCSGRLALAEPSSR